MGWFAGKNRERPASGAGPLFIMIFSKDRAAQVDLLLQSIDDHLEYPVAGAFVLYKSTTVEFRKGYEIARRFSESGSVRPQWVEEKKFRDDVLRIAGAVPGNALLMFLVDDDILFRPFAPAPLFDRFTEEHLFISTRCSRHYKADPPPEFISTEPCLEWKWDYGRKPVTWNYPYSVDGNIFRAGVMARYMARLDFKAPNSLEGRMHRMRRHAFVKRIKKAIAPTEAVLFNNPLNRVQTEGATWHQDVTAEFLNNRFLSGQRIRKEPLYAAKPDAIHYAAPLSFSIETLI
jgi:hypothetical protein